jgi:hypothetical protein
VPLTVEGLAYLLAHQDAPPPGGRQALDALVDGTLKGFPGIAARYGSPLDGTASLVLAAGGTADAGVMACALAAAQDPSPFIWGPSGPLKGAKAAAFVLEAGCPLLTLKWWSTAAGNTRLFPEAIRKDYLDSPKTYRKGAELAALEAAGPEAAAGAESEAEAEAEADAAVPPTLQGTVTAISELAKIFSTFRFVDPPTGKK